MFQDPVNSLILLALTLVSAAISVMAIRRLIVPTSHANGDQADEATEARRLFVPAWSFPVLALVTGGLLLARWVMSHDWHPLHAHVDGLILMAFLMLLAGWYGQLRKRLSGLACFIMPVVSFLFAWAVCASAWTYYPFQLEKFDPVWKLVHLTGTYLGTLSALLAATSGAMYLFVHRRLKTKHLPAPGHPLASLESLELIIVRTATLGFVLLTLGLISGMIIVTQTASATLGEHWYTSPKVILASLAWLAYAVLMNARRSASFRGTYAAWFSIFALVLLLATYGIVTALPSDQTDSTKTQTPPALQDDSAASTPESTEGQP